MFERRRPSERDIDDEIAFHLAEEARLREADGASPVEARAAATRAFGNVTLVRGVTRDAWGRRVLSTVGQDLRLGVRLLRRHAGFAVFSIVSLALGIGGTSAIFSLYDAIVLRALPVPSPGRLVVLSIQTGEQSNSFMPFPQFEAMRDGTQTLTGLFARTRLPTVSVASRGVAEVSSVTAVSGGYHATLGVLPATGRLLGPEDDRPGGAAAAVISHAYWRRRFAGDTGVLGATISLNQVPFTIVGVEPAGFHGVTVGQAPDVTIPIRALTRLSPKPPPFDHAFATWIEVMGRLRDGVPLERAGQELDARFRQASDAAAGASGKEGDSRFARETHLRVAPGTTGGFSGVRERYAQGLRLLLSLLAGVLLLATLNVAALLLSRAEVRRQEFATRLALGAGRARLVRQLLTEAAVIALCGGALGLGLAWQGSAVLVRMLLPPAPGFGLDVTPDLRVVIFTALVSMAGCLAFGLLPALRSTRSLRRESRAEVGGPSRRLLDRCLVVAQTSVALALVVCAALFVNSLRNLWSQDTGYDRSGVLLFSVDARTVGQRDGEALQTYRRVFEVLGGLPIAESASLSTVRPVSSTYYLIDRVTRIGDRDLTRDTSVGVAVNELGPGYFATLSMRLVSGRDFTWQDDARAPRVAIISQRLARRFVGDPVGQLITMGDTTRQVIGVAADARYARVTDAPRDVLYVPYFDQEVPRFEPTYAIRYRGTVADAQRAAVAAVRQVDAGLAPFRMKTLEVETQESFGRERMLAGLTTYFGAFAWLLAGVGLYGLLACSVTQRTREFGLRLAVGASPTALCLTVLKETATTLLIGVVLGGGLAVAAARLVHSQLYGVEPGDRLTIVVAATALVLLGACASFFPARRAARIDPMAALRQE